MNSATAFTHNAFSGRKKALALGVALALSAGATQAGDIVCTSSFTAAGPVGNFTMLTADGTGTGATKNGYSTGGTNDVTFTWNGHIFTSSSDYTGPGGATNATLSSPTTFFGLNWTAHDVQIFGPGTYSFDTTTGGGANNSESGPMTMTVGPNQLGAHMLFDWGVVQNIDVVNVWNTNSAFSSCGSAASPADPTAENCLWTGATNTAGNTASTVWLFNSTDNDGDGTLGVPMAAGGPFGGFNANFNVKGTLTLQNGKPCDASVYASAPNPFTFTDLTGQPKSTVIESNTITVNGLGSGISAPVSITGGEYSVSSDGGTTFSPYSTTVPATVSNSDMVKVHQTSAPNEDGTTTNATLSIGGVTDTFSVTTIDKKPDAFNFTAVTGATTSTLYESNAITVGGMDASVTTPINISAGGEYSINGGAYTNVAGTVQNGNTVKVRLTSAATAATTTIVTLTLGAASNGTLVSGDFSVRTAGGVSTTDNNFTMLDVGGGVTGGTNDVVMAWDQQYNTATSDPVTPATAHMQISSGTPFFGYTWTAHHIRVFGPGTYTINVDCTTPQIEAGTCTANADPTRNYTFTVGAGQVAAHMLFDWNTTKNIDVVDIWNQTAVFGPSPLYTGASGCANPAQVWDLMSSDWDGDGQNGAAMIDGPFKGFKANFNIKITTPTLACGAYTPSVNVADPSNAPGCSISSTPVSALKRADWWLVGGFLAWLGAVRIRLKRKTQS